MYLQSLFNLQNKSKLAYYGMAIAGWCFVLDCGTAIAQTSAASDRFKSIPPTQLLASATTTNRDLVGNDEAAGRP